MKGVEREAKGEMKRRPIGRCDLCSSSFEAKGEKGGGRYFFLSHNFFLVHF